MNIYDQNIEDYVSGFNHAALIAEYAPEVLLDSPEPSAEMDDFAKGFAEGKAYIEMEREQAELRVIEELESIRSASKELDKELGRER